MKNKFYMIEILCKDTDTTIYNDNYRVGYATYEIAKKNLNRLIEEEYYELTQMASDTQHYSIIDYIEDKEERYEREIHIETEDYEDFLTRYTIVVVEVEDINTRYDEEENFPIDDKLANKINGMIYKGIQVDYVWDTNTILFHKVKEELNDSDDFDCGVYRNYTEDYLANYIETQLNKFIDEKEKNNKTIYHLHNDYGEYNEYTTDENKIIMIYIDEIAQCCENNICMNNFEEEEYKNAIGWLEKIYNVCGKYNKGELDINSIIEQLNKEHNWLIEIYKKEDDLNDR